MSDRKILITELGQLLAKDPNGVELSKLTDAILAAKQRLVRDLDRGVSKDEYARLSSCVAAYDAGVEALPKLWASLNRTSA